MPILNFTIVQKEWLVRNTLYCNARKVNIVKFIKQDGVGNRLLAISSVILASMLSRRVVLVEWDRASSTPVILNELFDSKIDLQMSYYTLVRTAYQRCPYLFIY